MLFMGVKSIQQFSPVTDSILKITERKQSFRRKDHSEHTFVSIDTVVITICLPVLSTDPVLYKVAVDRELGRKHYQ